MGEILDMVPIKQQEGAALARTESVFMPVMSMDVALARRNTIVEFTKKIMVADQDFGTIPGTNKPSLLKPGAEKLCCFFGLEPEFIPIVEDADWTGDAHKGEPFHYVRYRCRLLRDGRVLGVGEGSCNSWESKYRYRDGKRKCPQCGKETIIKGKEEYGGGWLCFLKRGGCGAKFGDKAPEIVDQQVGRVPNPDIADVVNTIQKMAQKRALVAATLIATSASEFFTQDVEDQPREEAPIDTGGHPMNTREAQEYVRDRKVAEARTQHTPINSMGPEKGSGSTPTGETGGRKSEEAGNNVKSQTGPAMVDNSCGVPEVDALWKKMGSSSQAIKETLMGLHNDLVELTGWQEGEAQYTRICQQHGDPSKRVGFARRAVLELWKCVDAAKIAAANPAGDKTEHLPDGLLFDSKREAAYAD